MKPVIKFDVSAGYALAFGLFLGLAILKFGNPVILDSKIFAPATPADFWNDPWPTHWANWIFLPFALTGAAIIFSKKIRWPVSRWLWLLPVFWFGWQLVSATQSVDTELTTATFWQFFGCIASYFIGALVFKNERLVLYLLVGVLAGFTFCLVRAANQRLFEFPENRRMLVDGETSGWTNFPPSTLLEMKRANIIINTNGADVANPAFLAKFAKGRVNGTLVYPNALAGAILLFWPVALTLAFVRTKELRPPIRACVIALAILFGIVGLFWTGSKLGWLIAMGASGIYLLKLDWPMRLKWAALLLVLLAGSGIFAIRFHDYFAKGATSAGARLDYWRAAGQISLNHSLYGTGPGTFQRPYAQLKSSDAEMARLTHNDYLEQFSDSGFLGGIFYAGWIFMAINVIGRRIWHSGPIMFALFVGVGAWFFQGVGEFGLYIPALAWPAFTLLGSLTAQSRIE